MKSILSAIVGMLSFVVIAAPVMAEEKGGAVTAATIETVVTVVSVDRTGRTVVVRGPEGRETSLAVPPEAQNLDQVQPGSRFKVRYLESVAVVVRKGGVASNTASRSVTLSPKGDVPGGIVMNTSQITGVVEAIDYGTRSLSIRGPKGNLLVVKADDEVKQLDKIVVGDTISIEYTESLAMRMIKE